MFAKYCVNVGNLVSPQCLGNVLTTLSKCCSLVRFQCWASTFTHCSSNIAWLLWYNVVFSVVPTLWQHCKIMFLQHCDHSSSSMGQRCRNVVSDLTKPNVVTTLPQLQVQTVDMFTNCVVLCLWLARRRQLISECHWGIRECSILEYLQTLTSLN